MWWILLVGGLLWLWFQWEINRGASSNPPKINEDANPAHNSYQEDTHFRHDGDENEMVEKIRTEGLTSENEAYVQENAEELLEEFDDFDGDVQDEILSNL